MKFKRADLSGSLYKHLGHFTQDRYVKEGHNTNEKDAMGIKESPAASDVRAANKLSAERDRSSVEYKMSSRREPFSKAVDIIFGNDPLESPEYAIDEADDSSYNEPAKKLVRGIKERKKNKK